MSDQNWDWHWGEALEALQQFKNPNGVLALLAAGAPVPDWARTEIGAWLDGKRPPFAGPKNDNEVRLLAAERAYRETPLRPDEQRDDRIARIAADHHISTNWLRNLLDGKGRQYQRLGRDWRRWERVYLDPDFPNNK